MSDPNEICRICGEPRSAHVTTAAGPETHPREARGEGRYELVSEGHTQGGGAWLDDEYVPPRYRFVPEPLVEEAEKKVQSRDREKVLSTMCDLCQGSYRMTDLDVSDLETRSEYCDRYHRSEPLPERST